MARSKFILSTSPRNVINNYEISGLIDDMVRTYPIYTDYIQSNIRNYVTKRFPCVHLTEEEGHKIYQEFYKQDKYSLNPEVVISKSKIPEAELHQVLISVSLLTQIRHALEYLLVHNIKPKANYNINDLCRKADEWNKKLIKKQDSIEGTTEVVREYQGKTWVLLQDLQSFRREAALMRSCIRSYYSASVGGQIKIYSLRDEKNTPLVTMEVSGDQILQVKGFANSNPKKFEKEVYGFMLEFKMQKRLHMSDFEVNNFLPYTVNLPYSNEDFDEFEFSLGSISVRSTKYVFGLFGRAAKFAWFYLDYLIYTIKSK